MEKYKITQIIEEFAPLNLAETWDCSGWAVDVPNKCQIKKIMLCLTVTKEIVNQAHVAGCDMIISHHPLFFVPFEYHDINIYCAHTNLDRTCGGTTDVLIKTLGLSPHCETAVNSDGYNRYVSKKFNIKSFIELLKTISNNVRMVNNKNISQITKIGFCAGSGSEFINEAARCGAEAFVTGDIKFHTAVESDIVLFDIGHYESEISVLKVFEKLLKDYAEIIYAVERSPFESL